MKPKVVAFVPIKLNSERLPNKNILRLGNYPLCYYIFDTLLKVKGIDEVYVYCSDEAIQEYIPQGVNFLKRDKKLDGNEVKGLDIYNAFTKEVKGDIYVLAHATAPFISHISIQEALENVIFEEHDSSFSVEKIQTFAWYKGKPLNYELDDIPRTQDMEPILIETSGFFIFKREIMTKHCRRIGFNPYIKVVSSVEGIDIDTKEDFEFATRIIK